MATSFCHSLTQQQNTSSRPTHSKDVFDLLCGYVTSSAGSWDMYRVIECIVSLAQYLIVHPEQRAFADKIAKVMDTAGIALSLPKTLSDAGSLRHSIRHLKSARSISPISSGYSKSIARAYRHSIVDMMNLTNTVSQAALFLHSVEINPLKCVPLVDTICNVTSLGPDTIELIVNSYRVQSTQNREKKQLALLKIAKNVPSIVGSVLAIAMTFFSSLHIPAVTAIALCLNALWLSMKFACALYERSISESPRSTVLV